MANTSSQIQLNLSCDFLSSAFVNLSVRKLNTGRESTILEHPTIAAILTKIVTQHSSSTCKYVIACGFCRWIVLSSLFCSNWTSAISSGVVGFVSSGFGMVIVIVCLVANNINIR